MDDREKGARQSMRALGYAISRLLFTCTQVQEHSRGDPDGAATLKAALESGEARAVVTTTWTARETFEVRVVIEPVSKTEDAEPLQKFEGSIDMEDACRAAIAYDAHFATMPEVEEPS